jgi:hypothetical protein
MAFAAMNSVKALGHAAPAKAYETLESCFGSCTWEQRNEFALGWNRSWHRVNPSTGDFGFSCVPGRS